MTITALDKKNRKIIVSLASIKEDEKRKFKNFCDAWQGMTPELRTVEHFMKINRLNYSIMI